MSLPILPRPVFKRLLDRPLIEPRAHLDWEVGGVFAPAIARDKHGYFMLYRAFGHDRVSRLGGATSTDGVVWHRHDEPLLVGEGTAEKWGMEDPRTSVIDGLALTCYTAASGHQEDDGWHWRTRIHIASSRDNKHFVRVVPKFPEINNKDAVLFPRKIHGRYYMLHRPMPDIWVAHSPDLEQWSDHRRIMTPIEGSWQSLRIGAGAPPIETPLGWLIFHHGVDAALTYSMSAAILDIDDPTKVLYRLPYPLMVPEQEYELNGVVPRVIFGTSVIEENGVYRMYYGAADTVVAAAEIDKDALLGALADYPAETAPARALPLS